MTLILESNIYFNQIWVKRNTLAYKQMQIIIKQWYEFSIFMERITIHKQLCKEILSSVLLSLCCAESQSPLPLSLPLIYIWPRPRASFQQNLFKSYKVYSIHVWNNDEEKFYLFLWLSVVLILGFYFYI